MLAVYVVGPSQRFSARVVKRVKICAMVLAFTGGASGVVAHCLFEDWWNSGQQDLITLGYEGDVMLGTSTPAYVTLDQAFFELTGAWVAALCSSL